MFLSVEERQLIRTKISSAYGKRTKSYEELLEVTGRELFYKSFCLCFLCDWLSICPDGYLP